MTVQVELSRRASKDALDCAIWWGYRTARVRVMAETGHLLVYRIKSKALVEIAAVLVSKKTIARP